ncbi:MAG: UPF0175 family protein [bacterium]
MKVSVERPREAEGLSEEEVEQLFLLGLREMRIEKALIMLRKGDISLWKTAKIAGLTLREMTEEACRRGIEPRVTEEMIEELKK